MHTPPLIREACKPGFLRREHQYRREPGTKATMQDIKHRPRRPPARRVRGIAIKRILPDIEIKGRKISRAELMDFRINPGPIMGFHRTPDLRIQFCQAVQQPTLKLRQFGIGHGFIFGETIEIAQQPAQGIPNAPIQFRLLLQDFGADAEIKRGIGIHHPKAQNIRAILLHHILRRGHIAHGFGHFPPLLIQHKAMRQHGLEGRDTIGANRFQQR